MLGDDPVILDRADSTKTVISTTAKIQRTSKIEVTRWFLSAQLSSGRKEPDFKSNYMVVCNFCGLPSCSSALRNTSIRPNIPSEVVLH